jgi:hypothetical protein
MATTMKLKGGEERYTLAIRAGVDEKVAKKQIAAFHMGRVADAKQRNRTLLAGAGDIREITTVDGKKGAPLESVKVDGGSIVTVFPFAVGEIIEYIDFLLISRSPIGPPGGAGTYSRSHRLFADGAEADPVNPPLDAKTYMFLSNLPYARKIEGAKTRKPQGKAPSEGVYRGAVTLANQRFSNFAEIKFTFQGLAGEDRYPTIRIRLRT